MVPFTRNLCSEPSCRLTCEPTTSVRLTNQTSQYVSSAADCLPLSQSCQACLWPHPALQGFCVSAWTPRAGWQPKQANRVSLKAPAAASRQHLFLAAGHPGHRHPCKSAAVLRSFACACGSKDQTSAEGMSRFNRRGKQSLAQQARGVEEEGVCSTQQPMHQTWCSEQLEHERTQS